MERSDLDYFASHLADYIQITKADQRKRDRFDLVCSLVNCELLITPELARQVVKSANTLLAELEKETPHDNT